MDDTLPLVDSATLSDAEKKRLRNSHPLYGRMNGEVIWVAYEELGYDAETCATAMDAELDLRHRTVSLMATLEQCPDACCVLELPEAPCASCTACPDLEHLSIDAMTPQWRQWLPPLCHRLPGPCPPAVTQGRPTGGVLPRQRRRSAPARDALPVSDAPKVARSKEIWAFP